MRQAGSAKAKARYALGERGLAYYNGLCLGYPEFTPYSDNVLATADELDIIPVYLPTYSSWLNPIEKLWRWLKADVLRGHEFAHNPYLLRQVVAEFLDQFANGSSALLRYVGLLPV